MVKLIKKDIKDFWKFFNHTHPTELRVFDKDRYPDGKVFWCKTEKQFVDLVKKLNVEEGVDVYIGGRDKTGKTDDSVVSSEFIFFEIDEHDVSKPEQSKKVEAFLTKHNIEIGLSGISGGGYHYYIPHELKDLSAKEDREKYKEVLRRFKVALLEEGVDIDPVVFNFSRVSRILGSWNHKREAQSQIILNKKVDIVKNTEATRKLILSISEKPTSPETNLSALEILEKYGADKSDKWLYDIVKDKIIIKEDTGGNSVFFKNAAILCAREEMEKEEVRIIAKALSDLCVGRTAAAFLGWYNKALKGDVMEVNEFEINRAVEEGIYPLNVYNDNQTKQQSEQNEDLPFLTSQEILQYKKPKNFLIEDMAYPNEISMSVGSEGTFKSTILKLKATCLSRGINFLGFKTRKVNVALLSAENSPNVDGYQLKAVMKGLNIRRTGNLYTLTRAYPTNLLSPKFREKLHKFIIEKKIGALFIDTINPTTPEIDDNKVKDVTTVFNEFLKPFAEKYNLYIEFLHHTDKQKRDAIGSTKWKGNADSVYFFDRKDLDHLITISNSKNRFGEKLTLRVAINYLLKDGELDAIKFDVQERQGIGRPKQKKPSRKAEAKYIIKRLLQSSTILDKDLKSGVMKKGVSEGTYKNAKKELIATETIIKTEEGYKLK